MKITVKKVDALKRELRFEVSKERVAKKLNEVYDEISKVAKVRGFRPGKAPRRVVEQEHSALAQEEAIKKLIPEVYREGLEKENLAPIDLPEIQDVELKDGIITFTATIDIKPEIKIKNYKGIPVKRKSSKVTDEDLNKTLDYFKKSLGDNKEAVIDDAFAKSLGYPSLEAFKQSLSRQLEIDKDRQNRVDIENQIVNALLKEAKLIVPQTLVKRQMEHRLAEIKERLKAQGMSDEDINKKEEELRKNLKEPVERDVKVFLIMDQIAQQEGITVTEGESMPAKVMSFLLKEAQWEDHEESRIIVP